MSRLCAVILTLNEADQIADCIASLEFADRVIVFDSFSSDETCAIAERCGAEVMRHRFQNYAAQRNAALEAVADRCDWALFVDADERISQALAAEIREKMAIPEVAGWRLPRHNLIFGVLTKGAGWYPDYQTRLLRIGRARFDPQRPVHELAQLQGAAGTMDNAILHHNYRDLAHFREKQERYLRYDVQMLRQRGESAKARHIITRPLRHFVWRFITLRGYRDGWHGLRLSALMAWYEYRKYRLLSGRPRGD